MLTPSQCIVISYTNEKNRKTLNNIIPDASIRIKYRPIGKIQDFFPKYKDTPHQHGTIYGINCEVGKDLYIGETGNALDRRDQHDYALKRMDKKSSALAEHWEQTGHDKFSTKAPITYDHEPNMKICKIKEAYHIRKLNAQLNRKECALKKSFYMYILSSSFKK